MTPPAWFRRRDTQSTKPATPTGSCCSFYRLSQTGLYCGARVRAILHICAGTFASNFAGYDRPDKAEALRPAVFPPILSIGSHVITHPDAPAPAGGVHPLGRVRR